METVKHFTVTILAISVFTILGSNANAATFTGVSDLPGCDISTGVSDLSYDGSVLVGSSDTASGPQAFRWENGVMTWLGDLPGGKFSSSASAVSADCSVIVGSSISASGRQAFRWENGVMTGLGDLPGGEFYSKARDVSADGSIVVGTSYSGSGQEAFRWENGTMSGLGDLPGGHFWSSAYAISADGSVIVGRGDSSGENASGFNEAFRWKDGIMTGIGDLRTRDEVSGGFNSSASAVSADGSVIVGTGWSFFYEAFRWEESPIPFPLPGWDEGEMTGLGFLEPYISGASDVSADGSIVVGSSMGGVSGSDAFIWDEEHGMRSVLELLKEQGLDLTGWDLRTARGISGDGLTIIGSGINPDGQDERWVAVIPEPCSLVLLSLGSLILRRRKP